MNDKELRKKLSVLKSAPVPKGYWENYWPRLQMKLGRVGAREQAPSPWRIFIPVFAALLVGLAGYHMGQRRKTLSGYPSEDIHLASASTESHAQKVFKEMLQLFPDRVNWISFVEGKVDFSISSVAYPHSNTLIPLIISLPRAQEAFEVRLLVRPGQTAAAPGQWDKKTPAWVQASVSPDGRRARITCRLNGTSGIDTEVDISKPGKEPLGSFRWGERLVQVQLMRPDPNKAAKNAQGI